MTIKDVIEQVNTQDIQTIIFRCNYPERIGDSLEDEARIDGMMSGIASLESGKLISKDGDSYDINDLIDRFEYDKDSSCLTLWQTVSWLSD